MFEVLMSTEKIFSYSSQQNSLTENWLLIKHFEIRGEQITAKCHFLQLIKFEKWYKRIFNDSCVRTGCEDFEKPQASKVKQKSLQNILTVTKVDFLLCLRLCGLWTFANLIHHSLSFRCLSTQAKAQASNDGKSKPSQAQQHNQSFVHNLFRGQVEHSQVFPFPIALNQEQTDNIAAFVDPVTKFFEEVNDAGRNDENSVMQNKFTLMARSQIIPIFSVCRR